MSEDFIESFVRRAEALRVEVPASVIVGLETYFQLLARWNRVVNLTALNVADLADEAIDRLLLEPVRAATFFPDGDRSWVDLGSGGGSPAIPIKLLRPETGLVMVESRSRKVAFLREVVRELGLSGVRAEAVRFESLLGSPEWTGIADVITARAVRPDAAFLRLVEQLLRPDGEMLIFESAAAAPIASLSFELAAAPALLDDQASRLSIYRRV